MTGRNLTMLNAKVGKAFSAGVVVSIISVGRKTDYDVLMVKCYCGNVRPLTGVGIYNAGGCRKCHHGGPDAVETKPLAAGDRFGMLAVLSHAGRGKQGHRYRVKCDCGHETVCRKKDLRSGLAKSCGCNRGSATRGGVGLKPSECALKAGERYGKLTVVEQSYEAHRANARHYICDCDCGQQTTVRASLLRIGQTKSCGCLRRVKRAA